MRKEIKFVSAEEAVQVVKSGDHIHLSSVASAPRILIDALCARGDRGELQDVRIHHLHTEGPAPYSDPKYDGIFFHQAFFVGANVRKGVQAGYADYIPVFRSETQKLYRCVLREEQKTVPEEEAPANYVPAAAVIRRGQALSGMTGRKGCVGGLLS